jgi:hypothetical protein
MKNNIAAVGISLMLLLAGMPFNKVIHYCNHQLYKTSITFSVASVSCGMRDKHELPSKTQLTQQCCNNIVIPLQTHMDYKPSVPDGSILSTLLSDCHFTILPVYTAGIQEQTVKGSPPLHSIPVKTHLSQPGILRI